jgi:5-(carboxyamino)imidazole ribonucleotide mutase
MGFRQRRSKFCECLFLSAKKTLTSPLIFAKKYNHPIQGGCMALLPILIGSRSDQKFLEEGLIFLKNRGIGNYVYICSVHRDPREAVCRIEEAIDRKPEVIIAGAATATGLPGMVAGFAQNRKFPVLGVRFSHQPGAALLEDASFNLSAMPKGVPLAYCGYNQKGFLHACMLAAKLIKG